MYRNSRVVAAGRKKKTKKHIAICAGNLFRINLRVAFEVVIRIRVDKIFAAESSFNKIAPSVRRFYRGEGCEG